MNGIYIHVPFCKSKCPYCDFHSHRCSEELKEQYVKSVIDEILSLRRSEEFLPPDFCKQPSDSLYIGGGTPSVLNGYDLEKIITAAKSKFNITDNAEITIECNPASDIEKLIPHFINCGVNRISLGMQSAVETERRTLGRHSDKERISEVIDLLKKSGITNISLDVMLGIPEQTKESLEETLEFAVNSDVTHISAYILKIEEGTFFDTHKERYNFPSDDLTCDLYEFCSDYLEKAGFIHYEISNFAKPGFESRHNTKYWILDDYLGIGPSAHSFINGKRFYFDRDTQGFIDGKRACFDCYGKDAQEYIMLRLRLKSGLQISEIENIYGKHYTEKIIKKAPFLKEQGLVMFDGENLLLTKKGFLISNAIINEFI